MYQRSGQKSRDKLTSIRVPCTFLLVGCTLLFTACERPSKKKK